MQDCARSLAFARRGKRLTIATVLSLAAFLLAEPAQSTYLPSIKIGTAALISPSAADGYYGSSTTSSDGLSSYTNVATPTPPEIIELARALKNDPDLIYQYVHNNIQTVWMYGLQKGALGAEIDKSGTPFDQAELMMALLRQGTTPFTANYIAGTIYLDETTSQQFSKWTGITNARAACQLLANGGIPASVNDIGDALCSTIDPGTALTHVRMAHIWLQVTIGGNPYLFDPSYKTYLWKAGINLASAMSFTANQPLNDAKSGYSHGTDSSGAPWANTLNATLLNSDLQSYASHLLTYIQSNNLQGAQIEDIVSGGVVQPTYTTLRQTLLPYNDPSPPYTAHVWTPGSSSARYNAIPDKYRTTLELDGLMREYTDLITYHDGTMFDVTFFADEIYGRRLVVDTNFHGGSGGIVVWEDYKPNKVTLTLDGNGFANIPTYVNNLPAAFGDATARGLPSHIILTANHPYAASAAGTPTTNGDYMDATLDKNVVLITPISVVAGWGDTSGTLFSKWSDELSTGSALPVMLTPPWCNNHEDYCPSRFSQPTGDFAREKTTASWLAQFTRAARLNAAIANSVPQIHHALGFVYGDNQLLPTYARGTLNKPDFVEADSFDRVDIDAGISLTSKIADATARRAAIEALAASSAALEGSMGGQTADLPDTSSTATRFEWGNSPPTDALQNPYVTSPQNFYQFTGSTLSTLGSLVRVDAGNANSCQGDTSTWSGQPLIGSGECTSWKNALSSQITAYATNGFTVVASQEAFLGPGQRGGTILPQDWSGHPLYYTHQPSKQRGGAFVAMKLDGNGDPTEIAHIILGQAVGFASIVTKGGGGGTQPDTQTNYNPADAADILKSRFVDRSTEFGVNLSNGSLSYTSPVSLRVGNGGFPYELRGSLSWHPSPTVTNSFGALAPTAPQPGWVNNWLNSLAMSGSGLEAMGQSDIRAAAGAIASFYAAQDIYKSAQSPERDVAAVLTQSWWAHQMLGNTVTVNVGGSTRQFVQIATGQWIAPGVGFATLTQTGSRVPFEQKCWMIAFAPPYAMSRGWDYSNVSFQLTNAEGDVENFGYYINHYYTDDEHQCGRLNGFRLTSWTFPYGMSVTPTYTPVPVEIDMLDALTEIGNSLGRKLDFTTSGSNSLITNGLISGYRSITIVPGGPAGNPIQMKDAMLPANTTSFSYVGPFTQSATQRPVPYPLLSTVTTPNDTAHANIQYDYDTLGRVNEVEDANRLRFGGRAPYFFYLADGTRGERDDPLGQAYTVGYDTYGHPARYIDELAHETDAIFDSRGRPMQYVYPEGDCEIFGYDTQNNTTSYTRVDKVSLCSAGAGSAHVLTASATYDQTWNKPLTVTNARHFTTTLTYYASGNGKSLLHTATRPTITEGTPVYTFSYDALGKATDTTNPTGIVTHNVYDGSENLTSTVLDYGTTGHLNLTTGFSYDAQGDVTTTTDPRGFVTTSIFDNDRRKTEDDHHDGNAAAPLNAASKVIYDEIGRDIEDDAGTAFSGTAVTAWQMMKQTGYTPTSKVSSVTDADNEVTNYGYYDDDLIQTVTDPASRKVHFVYCLPTDANCAAKQVKTEYRGWVSGTGCSKSGTLQECYRRLTYSPNGEQATIKDANGNTTTYGYDNFIRLITTTFPDGGSDYEQLTLDENGNVTARRNRTGETLSYSYNALDWITQKCMPTPGASCPANPAVTTNWSYLLNGRIDVLSDTANNTIDYGYDGAGRQNGATTTIPTLSGAKAVGYVLDFSGNRTALIWPDNYCVGYTFDSLNRMTVAKEGTASAGVCSTGTPTLATYSYNPLSRRTNLAYGNGAAMGYSYYPSGDLQTLAHTIGGTANNPLYSFTYWPAHQLDIETISDSTYRWQPSAAGTDLYTAANNLNQYPSIKPQGAPSLRALGYDGKGNLTTGNLNGDGSWSFVYDAENRMLTACKPNCTNPTIGAAYAYDPLGRRTQKSGTGVTPTYYLSDGTDEIAEYNASGTMTTRYVPGPTIDEPIAMATVSSGAKEYFHTNHQGSVVAMTDATGAQIEGPYTYDSYGNCFSGGSACSSSGEPYRFTGRRFDAETGLYYYRARYYWPIGGRFMQTDPVGYGNDLNLYTYVNNDPGDKGDPLGQDTWQSGVGAELQIRDVVHVTAQAGTVYDDHGRGAHYASVGTYPIRAPSSPPSGKAPLFQVSIGPAGGWSNGDRPLDLRSVFISLLGSRSSGAVSASAEGFYGTGTRGQSVVGASVVVGRGYGTPATSSAGGATFTWTTGENSSMRNAIEDTLLGLTATVGPGALVEAIQMIIDDANRGAPSPTKQTQKSKQSTPRNSNCPSPQPGLQCGGALETWGG